MLNCLGLSDIILQCDPEPSLVKWAESVKSKRQERTVIRSSPRRSHQSNGAVENCQKESQGQVRIMLASLQDRTQYRPTTDSALMKLIVRQAAWLILRCRVTILSSHGVTYRGKLQEFGESVFAHLPEAGKGSGNPAPKLADTWKSAVWRGKSDLTDELTKELYTREAPSTAGQKKTSGHLSKHHTSRRRQQRTSHLQLNLLLFLMHHKKYPKM